MDDEWSAGVGGMQKEECGMQNGQTGAARVSRGKFMGDLLEICAASISRPPFPITDLPAMVFTKTAHVPVSRSEGIHRQLRR